MEEAKETTTGAVCMVDAEAFREVIDAYAREDAKREELIKKSRDLLKWSKQSIFSIHRNELKEAKDKLNNCEQLIIQELLPICQQFPSLRQTGMLVGGLEEYAEARIFIYFVEKRRLISYKYYSKILTIDEYLGGLMDCTGELNRFAVLRATEGDNKSVEETGEFINNIHEQMLLLDLRNSLLRRKYDSLKYTQKKIEALIYELSLANRINNIKLQSMLIGPEPEVYREQQETVTDN